jgi:hypothetical protein
MRKVTRDLSEDVRDRVRALAKTEARGSCPADRTKQAHDHK